MVNTLKNRRSRDTMRSDVQSVDSAFFAELPPVRRDPPIYHFPHSGTSARSIAGFAVRTSRRITAGIFSIPWFVREGVNACTFLVGGTGCRLGAMPERESLAMAATGLRLLGRAVRRWFVFLGWRRLNRLRNQRHDVLDSRCASD